MAVSPTVLIADDDKSVVQLLQHFLAPLGCRFLTAADGEQALRIAQDELPDVVLLDVLMPKRSGWDVCQALKAVGRTSQIAVVLVTAKGDVKDRLTGLQVGADDYLVKPFSRDQVVRRVSALVQKQRLPLVARDPSVPAPAKVSDGLQDPATGLPTVAFVVSNLREMLIVKSTVGVVFVDVQQFELIEAEYGWAFFDEFLCRVASIINEQAQALFGDCVVAASRVGSSSFYVFFDARKPQVTEERISEYSQVLNDRLLEVMHSQFPAFRSGEIGFFIGGAIADYEPKIRLERQIYRAMESAADAVRDAEIERRRMLTRELREIVKRRRLTTLFQPIARSNDGSIFGYEILTRGPKQSSFRNSDMLFSFAREMHLLWELEELSLQSAVARLQTTTTRLRDWKFLVNLEAEMFESSQFRIHEVMAYFAGQKGRFVFELTERAAIEDYAAFRLVLDEFRSEGIEIAIDDAGSGYASLEAIASLAPDYLKITRSLVSSLGTEPIKQDLVRMLVELGRKTGAQVLAEGIETEEEYEWCSRLGVDLLQGYYIGRPQEHMVEQVPFPGKAN
jgi:EAL domain-containing protein (putative c-di-GMP-specific phosphodiesterase class I)/ActR/RegA family two-component response regulator